MSLAGDSEWDESTIAQGLVRREASAFEHAYQRFYPRLVRFLLTRTDLATAEDIAQETLLKLMTCIGSFDSSRSLWPWLGTVAANAVTDNAKRRRRETSLSESTVPSTGGVEACEDCLVLEQAIARLPDRQRAALSLRYLRHYSVDESASSLGLTKSAFNQLVYRARIRLRAEYERLFSS